MCKDYTSFLRGFTDKFGAAIDAAKELHDYVSESEGICAGAKEKLLEMVDSGGAQLTEVGLIVALNGIAGAWGEEAKHAEEVQRDARRN